MNRTCANDDEYGNACTLDEGHLGAHYNERATWCSDCLDVHE